MIHCAVKKLRLRSVGNGDELLEHEVRNGEPGDDHDKTDDGVANHVFSGRDLLIVTTCGHPEKTGTQYVEEQHDAEKTEHDVDQATDNAWKIASTRDTRCSARVGQVVLAAVEWVVTNLGEHDRRSRKSDCCGAGSCEQTLSLIHNEREEN